MSQVIKGILEIGYIKEGHCLQDWTQIDLSKHDVSFTLDPFSPSDCWPKDRIRMQWGERLWLRIDDGPEFEIDDFRIPGHFDSYREVAKEYCQ